MLLHVASNRSRQQHHTDCCVCFLHGSLFASRYFKLSLTEHDHNNNNDIVNDNHSSGLVRHHHGRQRSEHPDADADARPSEG